MRLTRWIWTLIVVAGCGIPLEETQNELSGKRFLILSGANTLNWSAGGLSGTGRVLFENTIADSHVVYLKGTLEDGGEVTLFFHGNTNGRSGVSFTLERDGSALKLMWVGPYGNIDVLDSAVLDLPADGAFGLQLGWANTKGQLLVVSDKTPGEPAKYSVAAQGEGNRWGLELNQASLSTVID